MALASLSGSARGLAARLLAPVAVRGFVASSVSCQQKGKPQAKPAAEADDDIVMTAFKDQQRHFRELVEGAKNIPLPLTGDEASVKKYAEQMQALKKKIGMPDVDEVLEATLEYKLSASRGNISRFLKTASEGVELGAEGQGVVNELMAAVADIEAKTGAPLDSSNKKGIEMIKAKAAEISKKAGFDNAAAVKEQSVLDMYKKQLDELRSKVVDDMEMVKRRDGLEWVDVDLSTIKPT